MIHLHTHSEHSFLDGLSTLEGLAGRVAELGQEACALTDHGEVSGHLRWQKACNKYDVKPILGMEGYFTDNRLIKEGKKGEKYEHMTVIAKDEQGLRNLWALSSQAFLDGQHYADPRFDWELLEKYHEGLIVTGGCLGGAVSAFLNEKGNKYNEELALTRLGRLLGIFGDDFYLELHTFDDVESHETNRKLIDISYEYSVPLIACSDSHYLRGEDWQKHEILTASQMGKTYDDPTRFTYGPDQLYVHSEDDVHKKLAYLLPDVVSEAIANTHEIEKKCLVFIESSRRMPTFYKTPETDVEKLHEEVAKFWKEKREKLKLSESEIAMWQERLDYELEIIIDKGFAGYFLIVGDMIRWAKEQGLLVGPSRGSVGGSLLAYILGIIEFDPFRGGLIFERFINPDRNSLPDIDIDFPRLERGMVREYLEQKWEYVATIGSFMVLKPLQLLNDFCKVMKIPFETRSELSRIIKQNVKSDEKNITFLKVYERAQKDFEPYEEKYPFLFELMLEFSNHIRQPGAHAAGVVISKEDFLGRLPLRYNKKADDVRTQMDMHDVEELGYVKIDILGLRTLSTLMLSWDLAQKNLRRDWSEQTGQHPDDMPDSILPHFYDWQYEWDRLYGDDAVYKSLWDGHNIGVFQLETDTMQPFATQYKPANFRDLVDMISVYRPGITRAIDEETGLTLLDVLMRRRDGKMPVTYKHPILKDLLSTTYGNFVYQEQVMRLCVEMSGYTLSDADRIRGIIGKSKREEMKQERPVFIKQAVERGVEESVAKSIFNDIVKFGEYGFNLAHGWGYGIISFWCAWMKHYYPREFMTALFATNPKSTPAYIRECRRLDIEVLGPDISESGENFTLTKDGVIRCGLSKVKWVGAAAKELIAHAPFESVGDILERVDGRKVNQRVYINLARVGALDGLVTEEAKQAIQAEISAEGFDYGIPPEVWSDTKCALYHFWTKKGHSAWKNVWRDVSGQPKDGERVKNPRDSIHWMLAPCTAVKGFKQPLTNFDAYCEILKIDDKALAELELLDTPITTDPFTTHPEWLQLILQQETFINLSEMRDGQLRWLGGVIRNVVPLETRRGQNPGQKMCKFNVERPLRTASVSDDDDDDERQEGGDWEAVVCFPEAFSRYSEKIQEGAPVLVKIEKIRNGDGIHLRQLFRLDEL